MKLIVLSGTISGYKLTMFIGKNGKTSLAVVKSADQGTNKLPPFHLQCMW